jgi:hypothetical protein
MKSVAFALLVAVPLLAASAAAEDPEPPTRYPPSLVRPKLIAGGLAITGLAYGAGFLAASSWPEVPGSSELKIPVVGPWIALTKNDCAKDDSDCGFILYMRGFLTIIDGLMQAGGVGIAGEGVFMTTEASAAPEARASAITVRPAPIVEGTGVGLGVVGTF